MKGYSLKKLLFVLVSAATLASSASGAKADALKVAVGPDYVYADGYDENPGPTTGYVYVGLSGVSADDDGSKTSSDSPTCIWT